MSILSIWHCFIAMTSITTQWTEIFSIGGGVASQSNRVWSGGTDGEADPVGYDEAIVRAQERLAALEGSQ
jgi:hypothetical protein